MSDPIRPFDAIRHLIFTIAWWVLFFPMLWIISLPIIVFIAKPLFATVKDKYGKVAKCRAKYGVIFSPF